MKKILLVNQGLSANIGDKAILLALKRYYENKGFNVDVAGYTHFQETSIADIDYENYQQERILDLPIGLKWHIKAERRLSEVFKSLKGPYEAVIVGGGQLIKPNCYFPYALEAWIKYAKDNAKKVFIVGVGIDPTFGKHEKAKYKRCLSMVDRLLVRDRKSQERALDLFGVDALLAPDVAFLLHNQIEQRSKKIGSACAVLPFDYNTYKYGFGHKTNKSEYHKFWVNLTNDLLDKGKDIVFTYTTAEDKRETMLIYKHFIDNNRVCVKQINTVLDYIEVASNVREIYSGRMHALILGLVCGAEVHSVNISDKLMNFENEYILSNMSAHEYCELVSAKLDDLIIS